MPFTSAAAAAAATLQRVTLYDGQFISVASASSSPLVYELGTYLGGGASGVVYEATLSSSSSTSTRYAVKILHPLGFRLVAPALLARYEPMSSPSTSDAVVWMQHPASKDVIVCHRRADGSNAYAELSLAQCVQVYGMPSPTSSSSTSLLPPKYAKYLEQRQLVLREIACMQRAAGHENVLSCHAALEYVQDTKSTFFLVLDLAEGGELFDRISSAVASSEHQAKQYFCQLVRGVQHLHSRGVCHRDLKPENLLLDSHDVLKIADFGLSNWDDGDSASAVSASSSPLTLERFSSVVGSSHYTAPEILNRVLPYDGRKSDSWSLGVILYALLCGSLPFGKLLAQCARFEAFSRAVDAPEQWAALREWFLPTNNNAAAVSAEAFALLRGLLHPDPNKRFSVQRAAEDVWLTGGQGQQQQEKVVCMPPRQVSEERSVPTFQSPPLAPQVFSKQQQQPMAMGGFALDVDMAPVASTAGATTRRPMSRRLSASRARSTSPTTRGGGSSSASRLPHNPKVFLQHTKRSTRFTTTVPAGEILKTIEDLVVGERKWCARVEHQEEFKMQLLLADGRALGTVQVFLSRRRARAMYIVEFVRAHLVEIFEFKLFYRDLFPLLKTSLRAEPMEM